MSTVSKKQVEHVSKLANIPLKDGEANKFAEMFSDTLNYVDILKELDTKSTSETYQVTGLSNVYQEGNENEVTLSQSDAIRNAKDKEKGLIVTKGVFNES